MKLIRCFTVNDKKSSFEDESKLTRYINNWSKFYRNELDIISIQIVRVQAYLGSTSNFIGFVVYERKAKD